MPTAGSTALDDWRARAGLTDGRQIASVVTMPEAGRITQVSVHCGGYQGSIDARLVIWNNSTGAILGQSAQFTLPQRPTGAGAQAWETKALLTPYDAANGEQLLVGVARAEGTGSTGVVYSVASAGTNYRDNDSGATFPTAFEKDVSDSGTLAAYVTYEVGAPVWVRRSGAWVPATVYVWRSGAWVPAQVHVRRSGAWTP